MKIIIKKHMYKYKGYNFYRGDYLNTKTKKKTRYKVVSYSGDFEPQYFKTIQEVKEFIDKSNQV